MIDNKKKALTHIVADQLGWDDDTYRDILRSHAGVNSAGDEKLSLKGFKRFMAHAEKCGFKSKKSSKPVSSKHLLMGKIAALCIDMKLKQNYANGIAKRMFGVDQIIWCTADQLRKIVAALVYKKQKMSHASSLLSHVQKR